MGLEKKQLNISILFSSPKVQVHLIQVYRNLAATTGAAALACFMQVHDLLPSLDGLGFLLSFALLFAVSWSRNRINERLRYAMLLSFGFLQGWDVGAIVHEFYEFDHDSLVMALIATAVAFITFSGTAIFSARRSYLYLGGLLGTLTLLSLIGSFFRSFFSANLYLGLFILCFYIIYDTQVIIERAESGFRDEIGAAVNLFTDLIGIFVRLLFILNRQSKRRRSSQSKPRK